MNLRINSSTTIKTTVRKSPTSRTLRKNNRSDTIKTISFEGDIEWVDGNYNSLFVFAIIILIRNT